jgi:hypothetical protein
MAASSDSQARDLRGAGDTANKRSAATGRAPSQGGDERAASVLVDEFHALQRAAKEARARTSAVLIDENDAGRLEARRITSRVVRRGEPPSPLLAALSAPTSVRPHRGHSLLFGRGARPFPRRRKPAQMGQARVLAWPAPLGIITLTKHPPGLVSGSRPDSDAGAPKITQVMLEAGIRVIAEEYGILGPAEAEGLARDVFLAMAGARD